MYDCLMFFYNSQLFVNMFFAADLPYSESQCVKAITCYVVYVRHTRWKELYLADVIFDNIACIYTVDKF